MSGKTLKVQARMEPDLKEAAEQVFKKLGMTPTEAIRVFYRQVELHQGLPFEVKIPNEVTQIAINESEDLEKLESCENIVDFFDSL